MCTSETSTDDHRREVCKWRREETIHQPSDGKRKLPKASDAIRKYPQKSQFRQKVSFTKRYIKEIKLSGSSCIYQLWPFVMNTTYSVFFFFRLPFFNIQGSFTFIVRLSFSKLSLFNLFSWCCWLSYEYSIAPLIINSNGVLAT